MKNFFIVIGLLAVVIVAYTFLKGNKNSQSGLTDDLQTKKVNEPKAEPLNFDGSYVLDTETSKVVWIGKKKIIKEWVDKGTIAVKSGNISIQNSLTDWQGVSGKIVFDMNSIASSKTGTKETGGSPKLDSHLKSSDFFDVEKFPESMFMLTKVLKKEAGFDLEGELTIKGVTKPVILASINEIDFVEGSTEYIEAKGSVMFNRADFGVRFGSDSFFDNLGDNIIEDEVTMELHLIAKKQ